MPISRSFKIIPVKMIVCIIQRKTLCDKVCQWLATGRRFSPGPPVSSTINTDRHDITDILLKVALSTIKQTNISQRIVRRRQLGIDLVYCDRCCFAKTPFSDLLHKIIKVKALSEFWLILIFGVLTPLSAIFQLYHGAQF
jgi:hypothetical protein